MKREPEVVTLQEIDSPLGKMVIAATEHHLVLLEFASPRLKDTIQRLPTSLAHPPIVGTNAITQQTARELEEYFAGTRKEFTIPLLFPGTPFQEKVWSALQRIPYGSTCSYQDIAKRVSRNARGSRAVGRANGTNRICIVIPCHRVCNKGGGIGGYGGGIDRKEYLLALERRYANQE